MDSMCLLINFFHKLKFFIMKKIILTLCVILLCACSSNSKNEDYSNVEPVYIPCITVSENAIIAFSKSLENPTIQNTAKGCEITIHTAEGKQVFLLPYHYNLDEYKYDLAVGLYGKYFIEIHPMYLFEKGDRYYPYWEVRNSYSHGITFALPNGKFLSFIALDSCRGTENLEDNRFRVQDRTFNTTARKINIKIINVNRFGNARHYISPIYYPISNKEYSTPVEAKSLIGGAINAQYDAYRPADY